MSRRSTVRFAISPSAIRCFSLAYCLLEIMATSRDPVDDLDEKGPLPQRLAEVNIDPGF